MATYRAFVYCEKCDRPLRESEQRYEISSNYKSCSVEYYCRICNSRARKPYSIAGWMGVVLLTCVMVAAAAWLKVEMRDDEPDAYLFCL